MQGNYLIDKIAEILIAYAPIVPFNGCSWGLLGEAKLPKSMMKK